MSDAATMIRLSVNGEPREIAAGSTVSVLLDHLGLDRRKVAVERNEALVVRSGYESTSLLAGDRLEIVHFIGGG